MISPTPHHAPIRTGIKEVYRSAPASSYIIGSLTFPHTGCAGELAYSTKPTLFFNRGTRHLAATGGLGGPGTFHEQDGYGLGYASAQYNRHAFPYNTPFYATDKVRAAQPNYNTYSEYANLIKETGRDHAIVPEFNISEHLEFYTRKLYLNFNIDEKIYERVELANSSIDSNKRVLFLPKKVYLTQRGDGADAKLNYLTLEGADITSSAELEAFLDGHFHFQPTKGPLLEFDDMNSTNNFNDDFGYHHARLSGAVQFNQKYSHTDTLSNFSNLMQQKEGFTNNQDTIPSKITVTCHAVKKARLKNGFYPATRTSQIAKNFKTAFFDNVDSDINKGIVSIGSLRTGSVAGTFLDEGPLKQQTFVEPLFGPGLLYNSIKSGIAVDWPLYLAAENGSNRPPMYYAPISFISASGGVMHSASGGDNTVFGDSRIFPQASASFNYGGFQMLGSSRCIPAILNNLPNARLPFRALYDFSELDNALATTRNVYLPTDFLDLDRSFIFSGSANPNEGVHIKYSLPFPVNPAHPGYGIPSRLPIIPNGLHPGAKSEENLFSNQLKSFNFAAYEYFSSINNYLAETMRFFLSDVRVSNDNIPGLKMPVILPEGLEDAANKEGLGITFEEGSEQQKPFFMNVRLSMGKRQVMAEGPRRAGQPRVINDIYDPASMRGAIYGPPIEIVPHVSGTEGDTFLPFGVDLDTLTDGTGTETVIESVFDLTVRGHMFTSSHLSDFESYFNFNLQDPAYQAFTPPYFYGDSNFVFKYIPENSGDVSFKEVWSEVKQTRSFYYDQYDTGTGSFIEKAKAISAPYNTGLVGVKSSPPDPDALCSFLPATGSVSKGSYSRMKIDASLEFSNAFDITNPDSVSDKFSSAYIAPWWVCPVLDFSSSFAAVFTGSTIQDLSDGSGQYKGAAAEFYSTVTNSFHDATTGKGMWGGYGTDPYNLDALTAVRAADTNIGTNQGLTDKGIFISIDNTFAQQRKVIGTPQFLPDEESPQLTDIDGFFLDGSSGSPPEQTGSLADKLRFTTKKHQIGRIARSQTISEAVILIPYLDNKICLKSDEVYYKSGFPIEATETQIINAAERGGYEVGSDTVQAGFMNAGAADIEWDSGKSKLIPGGEIYETREIIPGKHFLPVQQALFQNVLSAIAAKKYVKPNEVNNYYGLNMAEIENNITTMQSTDVGKMIGNLIGFDPTGDVLNEFVNNGYQLPPNFDFIHNSNIKPFQMIVLPFDHTFTNQDLIDIYQGMPPDLTRTIEKEIKSMTFRSRGIENLQDATWMPSIPTESTSYLRDLEYARRLNELMKVAAQNYDPRFGYNVEAIKQQARAEAGSLSYDLNRVSMADLGLESFLVSPYSIINNEKMQPYIDLDASIGLDKISSSRDFYSKLKFMVFKVKQRGVKNYKQYRDKQVSAAIRKKYEEPSGYARSVDQTSVLDNVTYSEVYGANWPYDFFSLIETIKVDIDIKVEE